MTLFHSGTDFSKQNCHFLKKCQINESEKDKRARNDIILRHTKRLSTQYMIMAIFLRIKILFYNMPFNF